MKSLTKNATAENRQVLEARPTLGELQHSLRVMQDELQLYRLWPVCLNLFPRPYINLILTKGKLLVLRLLSTRAPRRNWSGKICCRATHASHPCSGYPA